MIDSTAAILALRNRAIGVSVALTGAVTLTATTTGYSRTTGSFLTDGFQAGMEITPSGFSSNPVDIIEAVDALTITTKSGRAAEPAATCSLAVGLPATRAWINLDINPASGRPFIEEDFIPATSTLTTTSAPGGIVLEQGLYILKWHGLSRYGVAGIRKGVDALKALFAPGTTLASSTDTIRIRGDVAPYASGVLPVAGGWSVVTLTIPWLARTTNAIT